MDSPADLFRSVAAATIQAETLLDERFPHGGLVYSIPKVEVSTRFGAARIQGKTFFWFGRSSRQDLQNTLRFRLLSARLGDARALAAASTPGLAPVVMASPFLVPLSERIQLVSDLKADLASMGSSLYKREIAEIDRAFQEGKDDPGITFLRLSPSRILIARIGGDNDGIFLRDNSVTPRHQVFSYMGKESGPVPWAPFHEFFEALRQWQLNGLSLSPVAGIAPPSRLGSLDISDFISTLSSAALEARVTIAAAATGSENWKVTWSLQDIAADLSYTVARQANSGETSSPLIRSVAAVELRDDGTSAVSLRSPEYILVGSARTDFFVLLAAFLSLDENDRHGFWRMLKNYWDSIGEDRTEYLADYKRALQDSRRRASAVVLLSYRGTVPLNQFMVVWTGTIGTDSEEREFAFRVKLSGSQLTADRIVLPLEDPYHAGTGVPSAQRPFASAQVEYDADHPAVHDFFHASWIWDLAGDWYLRSFAKTG